MLKSCLSLTNRQTGTDFGARITSKEHQVSQRSEIESRKSESVEYFLGLHCSSNLLVKNHGNKLNLPFGSKNCRKLQCAGGGVGLQWLSDGGQGERVPPCAVGVVCGQASVLANIQSNGERQRVGLSNVWPVTGRCSLSCGDVKCSVGYCCAFIFPSTLFIKCYCSNTCLSLPRFAQVISLLR